MNHCLGPGKQVKILYHWPENDHDGYEVERKPGMYCDGLLHNELLKTLKRYSRMAEMFTVQLIGPKA